MVVRTGAAPAPAPINAFHKSPSCLIAYGETMVLPDIASTIFEGEAELALVIGKAMDYIFGYLNFIDGSARDVIPEGNRFYQRKSRQTFAPIGPYLVTADEVKDPHNIQVKLWVNGTLKQNYNTSDMAHKIPRCIEWMSQIHDLEPGDILATGNTVDLECEGMGKLTIKVRDDLKRSWARETRLDREQKCLKGTTLQLTGKYATA